MLAQNSGISDKILIMDHNNDDNYEDGMSKSLGMYYKMKLFKIFYQILCIYEL